MDKVFEDIEARCREHIKSGSGSVIIEYLNASIEQAREELVTADRDKVQGIQQYITRSRKQVKRLTCNPATPQKNGAYSG